MKFFRKNKERKGAWKKNLNSPVPFITKKKKEKRKWSLMRDTISKMILSSWNKRNCMVHIERIIVLSKFQVSTANMT